MESLGLTSSVIAPCKFEMIIFMDSAGGDGNAAAAAAAADPPFDFLLTLTEETGAGAGAGVGVDADSRTPFERLLVVARDIPERWRRILAEGRMVGH